MPGCANVVFVWPGSWKNAGDKQGFLPLAAAGCCIAATWAYCCWHYWVVGRRYCSGRIQGRPHTARNLFLFYKLFPHKLFPHKLLGRNLLERNQHLEAQPADAIHPGKVKTAPARNRYQDALSMADFDLGATAWWEPGGAYTSTLTAINPVRLAYIESHVSLHGLSILDAGCGGGHLAEAMARRGASVSGVDDAPNAVQAARAHAQRTGLKIDYHCRTLADHSAQKPASCDLVTCMEMLEHCADPAAAVRDCATLVRPGGEVFFSTLDRSPTTYLLAILGAEYLLRILPPGTHDYAALLRPEELATLARAAGLEVLGIRGLVYLPGLQRAFLTRRPASNYLLRARRPTRGSRQPVAVPTSPGA